jgi:hypothetical protein
MSNLAALLLASASILSLRAVTVTVSVLDESGRPLSDVAVEALYAPLNDPRYASLQLRQGLTDMSGCFTYEVARDRQMIRLTAAKQGYCRADADHRHDLGGIPPKPTHEITLPKDVSGIPLHYKDAYLSISRGNFATKTWVGFDFQVGEPLAPWGSGKIADIKLRNDGEMVGWALDETRIEHYRRDDVHRLMSDFDFNTLYGRFQGTTEVEFEAKGAGIMRTSAFWPYSQIKMPPLAPAEGYAGRLKFEYDTRIYPSVQLEFTGFYLRLRPQQGTDGQLISANYAKIPGRIQSGYGWVRFRYYYNPTPGDRQLVYDPQKNLLAPSPGAKFDELIRYKTHER